jgi:hypothetical protein
LESVSYKNMAYYTEVAFLFDHLALKGLQEKSARKPVFLGEMTVSLTETERALKDKTAGFPRNIKVTLKPEDLIFKNIKTPVQDPKLLLQAIRFESRKYFRINTSEFVFAHNIWRKDTDGTWLTLLGMHRSLFEKYLPLLQAGFFLTFVVKGLLSEGKEACLRINKTSPEMESVRLYANGSLIGWNKSEKKDRKKAIVKVREYAKSLGVEISAKEEIKETGEVRDSTVTFSPMPFQHIVRNFLQKTFWRMTVVFAGLLIFFLIAGQVGDVNAKKRNLNLIDTELRKMQEKYQVKDLQMVRKRADLKGIEVSRIIVTVQQHYPKDKKVSRFEYKEGEVSLTIRGINLVEANQIKEALEDNKDFSQFHIEEGGKSDEKRIVFAVER